MTPTTVAHRPFMPETVTDEPAIAQGPATAEAPAAESTAEDDQAAAAAAETAAVEAETEMAAGRACGRDGGNRACGRGPARIRDRGRSPTPRPPRRPPTKCATCPRPAATSWSSWVRRPIRTPWRSSPATHPESAPELEKRAYLIPEPDNPGDRNAVADDIDARKIGYLPRESSAAYAALLTQPWAASHARAVCRAVVTGGSYKVTTPAGSVAEVDDEQFGVKLALAAPQHFDVTRELRQLTAEELAEGPPPI